MPEPALDNPLLTNKDSQPSVSEQLDQLVALDQQFRSKGTPDSQPNPETDRKNREEVQKMLNRGEIVSAEDLIKASLIFQHGETLEDISTAFGLSLKAVELGKPPVITILSQALDRYMVYKQKQEGVKPEGIRQRYGTQAEREEGVLKYYPLDSLAGDEEREMFEPLLEGFSSKSNEEQATITSRLMSNWQGLTEKERNQFINKIKEDFAKL